MGSARSKGKSKDPARGASGRSSKNHSGKRQAGGNSEKTAGESSQGFPFYAGIFLAFFIASLIAYQPALDGAFISDDEHYVLNNAFVHEITSDNLVAILDPTGTPAKLVENYAPVHLLFYALEWQWFERETFGYHVFNVAFHAFASLMLLVIFRGCGIARTPALLGSTFFLLHPANVEAVAWISQLKTPSALVLSLLALTFHRARPALAALLFALALFAKPTAAVALFVLVAAGWQAWRGVGERDEGEGRSWHWGWIGAWGLGLVVFAIAEFWAFNQTAGQAPVLYEDTLVRLRTVFAVSLRYVVMSLSSYGLSVFHEPSPAQSWFDPWWLGSLVVLGLLAYRTVVCLLSGRREALFWIWAAVSFAPICGIIPLPFPMADRYLYFILPGLIGGVLLAGRDLVAPRVERLAPSLSLATLNKALVVATVVWIALFAGRVHQRATVWRTGYSMMADAEAHYPQGMAAQTRIARRLALTGDAEGTVRALLAARARGYNRLDHLLNERGYDRVRSHPHFVELVNELAREWIDRYEQIEEPDQYEYRVMAQAYVVLDEIDLAIERIRSGIERPGPIREGLEEDLDGLLRIKRIRASKLPD
ncbi:MAG: hypothetical protein GY944_08785 [bacterium]|nr:hypothetical protein [bacterium]